MLEKIPLTKPKIDIELYGMDSRIPAIKQVQMMDEDSFEQFTVEWLYSCKKDLYKSIFRIGGAGDKGRDAIAYRNDGTSDYFQCKHYDTALTPTDYYVEFGKLCYYTFIHDFELPKKYYIIASNNVGSKLLGLIENPSKLREDLLINWNTYCENKITKQKTIKLDGELEAYIRSFDFSIVKSIPIEEVIDEHISTIYGRIRFGGISAKIPDAMIPPTAIKNDEIPYVEQLLHAYSEKLGIHIDSTDQLSGYEQYYRHFNRQRKDYYSIETIRRFVRDVFSNSRQFDILLNEIYDGVVDTCEQDFSTAYDRLVAVLSQAVKVSTAKSLLDSKLKCIGNSERKGACHMLVNAQRLQWGAKDV
jgi:hypothetical protein